jgi:hypothetical protein
MTRRRRHDPHGVSQENWRAFLVLAAGLSAFCGACRGYTERTIKDTEGRTFLARCSADRICSLTASSGPSSNQPSDDARGGHASGQFMRTRATGRVVGVCGPIAAGAEPTASDCRPVVCESDSDCLASEGLSVGVCINRLCTEPSHAINIDDAVMLCLAGTGISPRTALQVERIALGLNCGTPCRIPKPCRQP